MSSTNSQLRADLGQALQRLDRALEVLDARLAAERDYPLWVGLEIREEPKDKKQCKEMLAELAHEEQALEALSHARRARRDRDRAREMLRAIDYQQGQDPRATRRLAGLVGTSRETLAAAHSVNVAKAEVIAALAAMKGVEVQVRDPETGTLHPRPLAKDALKRFGHEHLHHNQTERKIETLDCPHLHRVSFVWAASPQTRRYTVKQVRQKLEQRIEKAENGEPARSLPNEEADLERLKAMADDEPLAEVRPTLYVPRANIVCLMDEAEQRTLVRAVQPILCLSSPLAPLPPLVPLPARKPGDTPGAGTPRRSDARIEVERFLVSMPIHRYLDRPGARKRARR